MLLLLHLKQLLLHDLHLVLLNLLLHILTLLPHHARHLRHHLIHHHLRALSPDLLAGQLCRLAKRVNQVGGRLLGQLLLGCDVEGRDHVEQGHEHGWLVARHVLHLVRHHVCHPLHQQVLVRLHRLVIPC